MPLHVGDQARDELSGLILAQPYFLGIAVAGVTEIRTVKG